MSSDDTVRSQPGGMVPVRVFEAVCALPGSPEVRRVVENEALTVGSAEPNLLRIPHPTVSRFHLEVVQGSRGLLIRDLGSTNGTQLGPVWIQNSAVECALPAEIKLGAATLSFFDKGAKLIEQNEDELVRSLLIGNSEPVCSLRALVSRIAPTDASVLLLGESGSGKELVARALHRGSPRAQHPFITVDCGAITPSLLAAELFGYERGAFTDAHERRAGVFERAQGGTLFLDEVGELPKELQPALLGVLERKRFRRVGGTEELSLNVRIIAATNRDLRAEVNQGTFRDDLFYRLAVAILTVPSLEQRTQDIPELIHHFLRQCEYRGDPATLFPPALLRELSLRRWPGNVRELRNLVEASIAFGSMPPDAHLAAVEKHGAIGEVPFRAAKAQVVSKFERQYLTRLLVATDGNVRSAARLARMDRSYLIELLKKHDLR